MRVLGLDPGTIKMGWALIESMPDRSLVKLGSGTIRATAGSPASLASGAPVQRPAFSAGRRQARFLRR